MPPKGKNQENNTMLTKEKQSNLNLTLQKNESLQENISTNSMAENIGAENIVINKGQVSVEQLMKEPTYKSLLESKFTKNSKQYRDSKQLVSNTPKESFEKMTPQALLKWATASSIVDGATTLFQNVAVKLEGFISISDKVQEAIKSGDAAAYEKELANLKASAQSLLADSDNYLQKRKGIFGIKFSEKGKSRLAFCKSLRYMAIGLISQHQLFKEAADNPYLLEDSFSFPMICANHMKENEAALGITTEEQKTKETSEKRGKAYANIIRATSEYKFKKDIELLDKAEKDETVKNDENYKWAYRFKTDGVLDADAHLDNDVTLAKCDFEETLRKEGLQGKEDLVNTLKTAFYKRINEFAELRMQKKQVSFEAEALDEGKLKNELESLETKLESKESELSGMADVYTESLKAIAKGKPILPDRKPYLEAIGIHNDSLYGEGAQEDD